MTYLASCGRNTLDVLRVIDSLQTADMRGIKTPINWQVGDDVIVLLIVSTEDAKKKFGEAREVMSYLRYIRI
jgi:peroxiredoxin (alkyl hydroperoxide reductase subunit C)